MKKTISIKQQSKKGNSASSFLKIKGITKIIIKVFIIKIKINKISRKIFKEFFPLKILIALETGLELTQKDLCELAERVLSPP